MLHWGGQFSWTFVMCVPLFICVFPQRNGHVSRSSSKQREMHLHSGKLGWKVTLRPFWRMAPSPEGCMCLCQNHIASSCTYKKKRSVREMMKSREQQQLEIHIKVFSISHELGENFGLVTHSFGLKDERFTVLFKKEHTITTEQYRWIASVRVPLLISSFSAKGTMYDMAFPLLCASSKLSRASNLKN